MIEIFFKLTIYLNDKDGKKYRGEIKPTICRDLLANDITRYWKKLGMNILLLDLEKSYFNVEIKVSKNRWAITPIKSQPEDTNLDLVGAFGAIPISLALGFSVKPKTMVTFNSNDNIMYLYKVKISKLPVHILLDMSCIYILLGLFRLYVLTKKPNKWHDTVAPILSKLDSYTIEDMLKIYLFKLRSIYRNMNYIEHPSLSPFYVDPKKYYSTANFFDVLLYKLGVGFSTRLSINRKLKNNSSIILGWDSISKKYIDSKIFKGYHNTHISKEINNILSILDKFSSEVQVDLKF